MSDSAERTIPDETTKQVDDAATRSQHSAGRGPTPDEAERAEANEPVADSVGDNYEDMTDKGANVRGEGAVMPKQEARDDHSG